MKTLKSILSFVRRHIKAFLVLVSFVAGLVARNLLSFWHGSKAKSPEADSAERTADKETQAAADVPAAVYPAGEPLSKVEDELRDRGLIR